MTDIYISADIEADGPIPGQYSMLAFGLALAGRFDGTTFEPPETRSATFYSELKPISDELTPAALGVARLDREVLARNGVEPAAAMRDAGEVGCGAGAGHATNVRRILRRLRLDVHALHSPRQR